MPPSSCFDFGFSRVYLGRRFITSFFHVNMCKHQALHILEQCWYNINYLQIEWTDQSFANLNWVSS